VKYRKRPVVVDAVRWTGSMSIEIQEFMSDSEREPIVTDDSLVIPTPEGDMVARKGDYIIKGVEGEFYPCKPSVFKDTYEPV